MKFNRIQRKRTLLINLLASGIMLCALFLSLFHEIRHIDHDCGGDGCPFCAIELAARAAFSAISLSGTQAAPAVPLPSVQLLSVPARSLCVLVPTLVGCKIKLNN